MDPDIDHAYKRHYQAQVADGNALDHSNAGVPPIQKPLQDEDTFQHVVPVGNEYVAPAAIRKDPLEDLIREFSSQQIEYIPAVDYKPVLISKLPSKCSAMRHRSSEQGTQYASLSQAKLSFIFCGTSSYALCRPLPTLLWHARTFSSLRGRLVSGASHASTLSDNHI